MTTVYEHEYYKMMRMREARIRTFMQLEESFNDWGGRGCRKFVPVLGGDGAKTAPPGDIFDQPPVN